MDPLKRLNSRNLRFYWPKVGGKYYAVDNKCPHFGADLSKGKLEGTAIILSQSSVKVRPV